MKSNFPLAVTALMALAMLAPLTASAHAGHGKHYDRSHHYDRWHAPVRSKRMPDWLYHQRHFRKWYRHSRVKHNRRLPWHKVYRIYQRQMHAKRYYGYWRDDRYDHWRYAPHRDRDYDDDRRHRDKRKRRYDDD